MEKKSTSVGTVDKETLGNLDLLEKAINSFALTLLNIKKQEAYILRQATKLEDEKQNLFKLILEKNGLTIDTSISIDEEGNIFVNED